MKTTQEKTQAVKAKIHELVPEKCYDCGELQIDERNCIAGGNHYVRSARILTLADVLRAMQSLGDDDNNRHWVVNRFGEFLNDALSPLPGSHSLVGARWNLAIPSLEDQSEECKAFLHSIICSK